MRADDAGGLRGGDFEVCDVEGGFVGVLQQPCRGTSGEDVAFDPDDAGDMGAPLGSAQRVGGIEHADGASLVTVASGGASSGDVARLVADREVAAPLVQAGLVVLDLDDQADLVRGGDFEMFF